MAPLAYLGSLVKISSTGYTAKLGQLIFGQSGSLPHRRFCCSSCFYVSSTPKMKELGIHGNWKLSALTPDKISKATQDVIDKTKQVYESIGNLKPEEINFESCVKVYYIHTYIYIYIYRVNRNFCKNHWNDYSSINTQYSLILRLFSKNLACKPIEKCLFFVLLSKISLFFFYFLQVLKPRPRGHPFPRSASTTYSLKKNGFFSCLLKLHNLKVSELQKELYPPKLRELEQF